MIWKSTYSTQAGKIIVANAIVCNNNLVQIIYKFYWQTKQFKIAKLWMNSTLLSWLFIVWIY